MHDCRPPSRRGRRRPACVVNARVRQDGEGAVRRAPSWIARKILSCRASGSSPISSRKRVPPCREIGRTGVPRKSYSTERIVTKLRQAEVELGRGLPPRLNSGRDVPPGHSVQALLAAVADSERGTLKPEERDGDDAERRDALEHPHHGQGDRHEPHHAASGARSAATPRHGVVQAVA